MKEFFTGQMDFIFFVYGLAFLLLFFTCNSLQKQDKTAIPWNYLGLFGLVHGITEWLSVFQICLGDSDLFKWARIIVMAVSYIYLMEFGRLTCVRLDYFRIGRWIYIPILMFISLEILTRNPGLNALVRYSLGFTGGIWAACAFWRVSKTGKEGHRDMLIAVIAMLMYAIASGLITNDNAFLNAAGFPVQLLRGFLACVIGGMIWRYHVEIRIARQSFGIIRDEMKYAAGIVLAVIFTLLFGWLWLNQAGQREALAQRAKILSYSRQTAVTLDVGLIEALTGSASDIENPAYQLLKSRLRQVQKSMDPVRFVYLMRKINGKIVVLVDSGGPGIKDESLPGRIYDKVTPKLMEVFAASKNIVEGPYTDRGGVRISAYASLNDERSGELITVLGIDQNADNFSRVVVFERLEGIVYVAVICLGMLFMYVYWQRFLFVIEHGAVDEKDLLLRWGIAWIVALIGGTVTFFLFFNLRQDTIDVFQSSFLQSAMIRAQSISQELDRQLDRLDGLRRYMDSRDFVEREEFKQYVTPLLKGIPVRAFGWIPRVAQEDRVFYECSARQDGLDGFRFYEKDLHGKKIPVLRRKEYFPVYYDEPLKGNEEALGFDEWSESVRRISLEKARDTGQPVTTPPLELVTHEGNKTGTIVFMPVYSYDLPSHSVIQRRKGLKGFVFAVYSADEFLNGVYSRMPPEGLTCLIEDPEAPKDRRVLYRHKIREGKADWEQPPLKYETFLQVADRRWQMTIIPGTTFIERNLSKAYWWVLFIGMLLTALVAALLNFLATARYRAELLVKLRTEQLNNEKNQLRKKEEDFHLILDSTAEAIYGVDLENHCIFCNPSCVKMLGFDHVKDLLGKNMHALIHHSYPDQSPYPVEKCPLYLAFKSNEKVNVEEVFWRSDGTSFPVEVWSYPEIRDGKLVGAVVSFLDITGRKKSEEALRDSRERYKKITSSVTDYIYHVHIEGGKSVSTTYSPGCFRVTGYYPEEFLSDPFLWINIIVEEDRPIAERQIRDILSGTKVDPIEHRIRHKDGHLCWVSNTIVLQYDNAGNLVGYDGLIADVSERKKAEEALMQAKETAEQALAIKDEFTSTVSHELRTPLAAIKSSIDILETGVPGELTQDQRIFINRVKSNIDRLARLINDVLDLSKLEAGKMVMNLMPLRAETVVQEVVDIQVPLVKVKGLKILTEIGRELPALVADKDRLIQVLNNLINNALKFTTEGTITVGVQAAPDKEGLTFYVRDTGVGIKDEDLSKLFKKFQQVGGASQQVAGTGLGLAICKLIISKHKGHIWVESKYGVGSSFNFNIPLRKEKRILIVDDDEVTLELWKKILEDEKVYEIEVASDGFMAIQKYYDFSPQLMLLDINLPKINGLEVCSRVKKDPKTKQAKIIIISSFNSDLKKNEAWEAGADEVINKPVNTEELIAKVRKLI